MSKKNKNKNKNKVKPGIHSITALVGREKHVLTGATRKIAGVRYSECEPKEIIHENTKTTVSNWLKSSIIDAISFQTATKVVEEKK